MNFLNISALLLTIWISSPALASLEFDEQITVIDGCEIVANTHCENADLRQADLRYATFKRSTLDNADLALANLDHADLRSSTVRDANLEGVNA